VPNYGDNLQTSKVRLLHFLSKISYLKPLIDQPFILTNDQTELLKIISKAHDKSISEYIQKAVIETMKTEIEFGDFCDILLDKLDNERELM
jgi:hypothetical protein